MSNKQNLGPSFGISRNKKKAVNVQHVQQAPILVEQQVPQQFQQPVQQFQQSVQQFQQPHVQQYPRHQPPQVTEFVKFPIIDLDINYNVSPAGTIVLNSRDGLLYYSTGAQWIQLAVGESFVTRDEKTVRIKAPENGNIHLIAGNDARHAGGHILFSAGSGATADGEIYLDIGGERALTVTNAADIDINSGDLKIIGGDLVINHGNLDLGDPAASINCIINTESIRATVEIERIEHLLDTSDSDSDPDPTFESRQSLPEVTLNGMCSILTINCKLQKDAPLTGQIKNGLVQKQSCVTMTAVCAADGAIPYAWINSLQDGIIDYSIVCLFGTCDQVQLNVQIVNPIRGVPPP